MSEDTTGLYDVIQAAKESVEPKELEAGKIYAVVDANGGVAIQDILEYLPAPTGQSRGVIVNDVTSFVEYIAAHSSDDAEIYSDGEGRFTCLFDPNGWRKDRVKLTLKHSPEWLAWAGNNGKLLNQLTFADFIEDQISSISKPDGAKLLEIVQSMQANIKVAWKSAEWLANGERSLLFDEQIEAKAGKNGRLPIPAQFTLALRPFLGGDALEVMANLRYRITDGILSIGFKLIEPERRLEFALEEVTQKISSDTEISVWTGQPG